MESFAVDGKKLPYFWHWYNTTWLGERAVEIPVFRDIVGRAAGQRILEVGNVLSHYDDVRHDVLDKYEKGCQTIRKDVLEFNPAVPYDLVVSISTIEHVGWDEEPRDPEKALRAVRSIVERCLAPQGRLVISVPVGYHVTLDRQIDTGRLAFDHLLCLKRVSRHEWTETTWANIRDSRYGKPWFFGNGLAIGTIHKGRGAA
jgi:hypothetical protein